MQRELGYRVYLVSYEAEGEEEAGERGEGGEREREKEGKRERAREGERQPPGRGTIWGLRLQAGKKWVWLFT